MGAPQHLAAEYELPVFAARHTCATLVCSPWPISTPPCVTSTVPSAGGGQMVGWLTFDLISGSAVRRKPAPCCLSEG